MKYGPFDKAEVYQTDYHNKAFEVLDEMSEWLEANPDAVLLCINVGMDEGANYFGTLIIENV